MLGWKTYIPDLQALLMSDVTLFAEVTTFYANDTDNLLVERSQAGNGTNFSVTNPATGKIIADVVSATPAAEQPCRAL